MDIKLYCVKNFTGSALKSKLELMLADQKLPHEIVEVNNPEDFVKEGISSIPSIKVMDKVITHQETCSIEDTVNKVFEAVHSVSKHYILVPIDFTPESIHALRYAMMMASHLNKGITIAHIHEPLIDQLTNSAFDDEMMKRNRQRLDEMIVEMSWYKFKSGSHIPLDIKFETGYAASQISTILNDEKYDFIIMSTKAQNTFWKRILSSVSLEVSRRSHKPVIIVPPDAEIKFPQKMVVGVDSTLLYESTLDFLLDFASDNSVHIEFVHVADTEEHFEMIKKHLTERILTNEKELKGFDITPMGNGFNHIHESLQIAASHGGADILVLMTHHRNLINSIGHRSTSRRVLLKPHLPVMIVHGEDEAGLGIIDYLYGMIQEG